MGKIRKIFKSLTQHKARKLLFASSAMAFLVVSSFFYVHFAKGSNLDNVTGYAWEMDNSTYPDVRGGSVPMDIGAGWISFNCTNLSECNNSNYGVNFNPNTGELVGYAYSSNYGWLKFGGLNTAEMPDAPGNSKVNAKFNGIMSGGVKELHGWARFCGPTPNPSLCTGQHVANSKNGGWDGWVSLRGTSPNYGVTFDGVNNRFGGYAWGGNGSNTDGENVVSWITFDQVVYSPVVGPKVTISADDTFLPVGGRTTIRWNAVNVESGPDKCEASEGPNSQDTGDWANPNPPKLRNSPSGTFDTGVLNTKGEYKYVIRCKDSNGQWSAPADVTVKVGTRLYLIPSSTVVFGPNFEVDLSWYSDSNLINCVATTTDAVGDSQPPWPWKNPGFDSLTTLSTESGVSIKDLAVPVKFDLKCSDGGVYENAPSVYVTRGYNEQLSFSNTKVVYDSQDNRYETTLKWNSTGMQPNSCVPSSASQTNTWDLPTPKTTNLPAQQSDVEVPGDGSNRTFTITCTGESGKIYSLSLTLNKNSKPKNRVYTEL